MFELQLYDMLSGYLNVNIVNNDKKSYHIHTAKTNLLRCIIFLILSFIPFSSSYFQHKWEKTSEEIIIKNLNELKPFKLNNIMSEKPVKPTPPPPPPPRLVKEGKEPTPPPRPKRKNN